MDLIDIEVFSLYTKGFNWVTWDSNPELFG